MLPKLYLAAPLFSTAELAFNKGVAEALSPYFEIYLPQEDGLLLAVAVCQGEEPLQAARRVFLGDTQAIASAAVLLAILDGRTIDEGVAFEIGYAYALGLPCFGLQTDPRRLLPVGNNPMIQQALTAIFSHVTQLTTWAANYADSQAGGRSAK